MTLQKSKGYQLVASERNSEGDIELFFRKSFPDGGPGRVFVGVLIAFLLATPCAFSEELRALDQTQNAVQQIPQQDCNVTLTPGPGASYGKEILPQVTAPLDPKPPSKVAKVKASIKRIAKSGGKKVWDTCVIVGEKAKPIMPFLNLCGACGSIAGPFVFGFKKGG